MTTCLVGIGTSAGGLRALEEFFDTMPADSGASFVVVQHLSPNAKSLLKELLERRTAMGVRWIEDGMTVEPNTVYLMPPGHDLILQDEQLRFIQQQDSPPPHRNLPIDRFFSSLAQVYGDRAIGVVLSGTGSDGTKGLASISTAGGCTFAQTPDSAELDGMPHRAIAAGRVDHILSPAEIAQTIYAILDRQRSRQTSPKCGPSQEEDLKSVQQTLQNRTAELEASEARLAGILALANDAIISVNLQQQITLFNKGAESIFGYTAAEVLGQPLSILMPNRYAHTHHHHVQHYADSQDGARPMAQRGMIWARRKDGSEFPAEASISKLELNGEVTFTTFLRDISEREKAKAALSHLAAIITFSGDAIISKSLDGVVTSWNRGAELILGYTAEEMVGQSITPIIPEHKRTEEAAILERVRQGESMQLETQRHRKDGHLVDLSITISPIRDQDGRVIGASKIARDISDRVAMEAARQQAEAALQDSESTKHAIIQAIPDLLIHMKVDGTYLGFICNTEFNVLPSAQFHPNMHITEILPPDIATAQLQAAQIAIASGTVQVLEQSLMVNGIPCYEEVRIAPLRADEVLVMIRDMSDRRQAELQLHSSEQRLQLALEASRDGLWDWDIATGHVYMSPRWVEMLGYPVGELSEHVDTWAHLIHPDDTGWVMQRLEAHLANPSVGYNFEYRMKTKQGNWLWIANYGKVVDYDPDGKPCRMIGLHRDISEQKQKEAALQAAREASEAANQAKSIFLANMSHELRTPLNVILGFAQVMRNDPALTPSQGKDLDTIRRSGDHLLSLINDVLDLSKIEAGKLVIDNTPFDLWGMLHTLDTMMAERAKSKGISLEVAIAPDVPQFILADEQKIRQVLLNLLSNAVKFTHQGGVILRVCQLADDRLDGGNPQRFTLEFTVIDTGVGIDPAEQEAIFDPFVQADSGRKTMTGTGLGLTISRKLLELMHGSITIQSVVNQGSTFTVVVPVQRSDRPVPAPAQSMAKVIGLAPGQPTWRILVVDDQLENQILVIRILADLGLEVRQASNGQEAVYCWQVWQPDLILMDLRMPGMDGYTATQQIRTLEQATTHPPTVIIALTAQAIQGDRDRALSAGCNDYISKPFATETLLFKLQEHIGVAYLYDDTAAATTHPTTTSDPAADSAPSYDHTLLAQLPPRWLHNLEDAALCLDDRLISQLIAELPAELAPLSRYISDLVDQFQFEQLITWIHAIEH